MLDLSVIILTYNEELHIRRCIENIKPIAKKIFLVDSFSTDRTVDIAKELGAEVYQNRWENNYAKQFNWGLDHLPIDTTWVLRLDADEYLSEELKSCLLEQIPHISADISGLSFRLQRIFMGKEIHRGLPPITLLRMFRYGKGRCESRWMDEHIQISKGQIQLFNQSFADHNLNSLSWWTGKHNGYAIREAIDLLDIELGIIARSQGALVGQAAQKRNLKYRYAKLPLFWRSFAYFLYRYFLKLGFLEGKEAFLWHFLQGWWYRTLVDAKVYEIKKSCGTDPDKITAYIQKQYNIKL